jgi:hypothetical protein
METFEPRNVAHEAEAKRSAARDTATAEMTFADELGAVLLR